jgi:hypothetical protein
MQDEHTRKRDRLRVARQKGRGLEVGQAVEVEKAEN